MQDANKYNNTNKMAGKGQITGKYGKKEYIGG
jgi:hypothetical protein